MTRTSKRPDETPAQTIERLREQHDALRLHLEQARQERATLIAANAVLRTLARAQAAALLSGECSIVDREEIPF